MVNKKIKTFQNGSWKSFIRGFHMTSKKDFQGTFTLQERFKASLVLSGVGDAMGYRRGKWEFNYSGKSIQKEMMELTDGKGVLHLNISKSWIVSDDTVMQLATAEALISGLDGDKLLKKIASNYVHCFKDMDGRAPGRTTILSIKKIKKNGEGWDKIPFTKTGGGGCGASMRSSSIGLLYHKEEDFKKLLEVSIESGRMTHNNPIGYLGSFVSALFNSYAINSIEPKYWANKFLEHKEDIEEYIKESGRDVEENLETMQFFFDYVKKYIEERNLPRTIKGYGKDDLDLEPEFPSDYDDVEVYDEFYKKLSFSGWGGASGHDSVIIALDALLYCLDDWEKLCHHAILHGGDNDSTGSIAGSWYGALYGFKGVPKCHYEIMEYVDRLEICGEKIYDLASKTK